MMLLHRNVSLKIIHKQQRKNNFNKNNTLSSVLFFIYFILGSSNIQNFTVNTAKKINNYLNQVTFVESLLNKSKTHNLVQAHPNELPKNENSHMKTSIARDYVASLNNYMSSINNSIEHMEET